MRGYFGIGSEGISKAANLGAVMRTAHAFGASFVYTVNAAHKLRAINQTDTSRTLGHVPYYQWDTIDDMRLPEGCVLVGIELCERAVELPSFRHPPACAYILGPEKGSLSPQAQALCTHIVKIPTRFCINLSLATALTLYDRTLCLGGYPERPLRPGGPDLAALEAWKALRVRNH
ncbi:MAG TPA: TrmH family RNA methyltransferase [Hellea balneolensis]|uniref:TrmH family RNA methyltransferase n=2 Tax=Hellea balneolensis TaxID=287478 RepID=A0A7C5LTJ5_9PROT|nr:TrmH family RNA methyltransferase [Hellea balneolensis]